MTDNLNDFTIDRYPLGEPTFEKIRRSNRVYVDKTALIYRLIHEADFNFLSRPRRFGKSLLLSTLKAFFEGRRDLFKGLAIDTLEQDWTAYPVISIELSVGKYETVENLRQQLSIEMQSNATELGVELTSVEPEAQFYELIQKVNTRYASQVVILIDEYDKPLLDTRRREEELHRQVRDQLRAFYVCIKQLARYVRFAMITGITKFGEVSIFSGLNNLRDISLQPAYNAICGLTDSEMEQYFADDIEYFARQNKLSVAETRTQFRQSYDGYLFAHKGERIYNPYSVLTALCNMRFGKYWFHSGTSLYLVRELSEADYDFFALEGRTASEDMLQRGYIVGGNPLPLLYQSGYLTIHSYDRETELYTLGFPNQEVRAAFFDELLEIIVPDKGSNTLSAATVSACAMKGDPDGLMQLLNIGLQSYNYEQLDAPRTEKHMVIMLHALCMAMGLNVDGEVHTARGRIDMVIQTKRYIYLIEFKINSYPRRALRQIDDLGYAERFAGDPRRIIKIGANYSTAKRRLTGWLVE